MIFFFFFFEGLVVFSLVQFCLAEDFYFCQECLSVCYVKPCRDDACQTDESLV